jgi:hypothetical protein
MEKEKKMDMLLQEVHMYLENDKLSLIGMR